MALSVLTRLSHIVRPVLGFSITTVLSFGCEVSDKSIRSLTEASRCSLGLKRTLPFRSLHSKGFNSVAICSFHKTRAHTTAAQRFV